MRAIVKSTGKEIDVRPLIDGLYIDEQDNVYKEDELDLEEDSPAPFVLASLMMKNHMRENLLDWRQKRFDLVQQFIDIYQAPATNMNEIIALADRYIKALMESE